MEETNSVVLSKFDFYILQRNVIMEVLSLILLRVGLIYLILVIWGPYNRPYVYRE